MSVGADLAREKDKTAYVFLEPIDSDDERAFDDNLSGSPESEARKLLWHTGVKDYEKYTAGELVYLANLIAEVKTLRRGVHAVGGELETAKATIRSLTEERRDNQKTIASMEEAISNCLGPYGKNNEKATDQLAALKVCNEKLSNDNKELRDENNILQQEVALLKSKRKKDSGEIASLKVKISRIKKEFSGKWQLLEVGDTPRKGDQAFLLDSNNVRCWVEPDGFTGIVKEGSIPVRRKITI